MARKKANAKRTKKQVIKTADTTLGQVKSITKNTNEFLLETSEEVIKTAFKRGAQWQKLGEKTMHGGLELAATQQDLMFDTLEVVKGQIIKGRKRFKTLFSKN